MACALALARVNERARIFASLYIFYLSLFFSIWVYIFCVCVRCIWSQFYWCCWCCCCFFAHCTLHLCHQTSMTLFFLCRQLNINFTPKTIHSLQVHSLLTLKTRNILRDVRAINGKVHLFVKLLVLCNSHYYYYPKSRDALCVAQHFFLIRMLCMKRQRVRSLTPNNIPSKPSFVRIYLIQTEHILI